uniref:Inter-alpha-trypsin inhibitor heavy chain 1 n=2 Tax=Eptatretus burgeri TaxID=7764 RepID=A0A8C4QV35_EPTBU
MYRLILHLVLFLTCFPGVIIKANQAWDNQSPCPSAGISNMQVTAMITARFAYTHVASTMHNNGRVPRDAVFHIQLPKEAFISNFTMTINGTVHVGRVMEKLEAKMQYKHARWQGRTISLLRSVEPDMQHFTVTMSVAAGETAHFQLTYEQLLRRRLEKYDYTLSLRTAHSVRQMQVDVYIDEPEGIRFLKVSPVPEVPSSAMTVIQAERQAHVTFRPCPQVGKRCSHCDHLLMRNNFHLQYDVVRHLDGGRIEIVDGYFVHYFAPSNLPPVPKNIIFIVDVSGSMWGVKIQQTKQALLHTLGKLQPGDHFNLVNFNHHVESWADELMEASESNKEDAKLYVQNLQADGGTNINDALLHSVGMLQHAQNADLIAPNSASLIVLLSDGDPTVGVVDPIRILSNVQSATNFSISLFCLGFGSDVDFDFLERMAMENRGTARRIYLGTTAGIQLQGFYDEVTMPLLSDVRVDYMPEGVATNVTKSSFDHYFRGSELVLAGKMAGSHGDSLTSRITAASVNDVLTVEMTASVGETKRLLEKHNHALRIFPNRLWVYLTINQLLARRTLVSREEKTALSQRALDLSLEYNLVTPFTSMVVTTPEKPRTNRIAKSAERSCCPVPPGQSFIPYATIPPPPTTAYPFRVLAQSRSADGSISRQPPFITSVDNDPHVIINLPTSNLTVCFNIDDKEGTIFSLVSDELSGIAVNGQLINSKRPTSGSKHTSSYFGRLGLVLGPALLLEVSPDGLIFKDGETRSGLNWAANVTLHRERLTLRVDANQRVTIELELVTFVVLLHRVWKSHPEHRDFLGFYTDPEAHLSSNTTGLLGQFVNEPEVEVFAIRQGPGYDKPQGTMRIRGQEFSVTRGLQKNYRRDQKHGEPVACWFVHNHGKGLLRGRLSDYIVPSIFSFL